MANQIFLSIGAKEYGPPATLEKANKAVTQFLKKNLSMDQVNLTEGSGLSRSTKVSCSQMLKILLKFIPYHHLLEHRENEFFKTGILHDVRTRAGYFIGSNGHLYPFVIMANKKNERYRSILQKIKLRGT